jgi:hypothetical protein
LNSGEVVAGELVISGGYAPEVLEPAEASFDDVSTGIGAFVETMQGDAVGLVWNDGFGATIDDVGSQSVAIIALVGDERAHGRGECEHFGCNGDIGVVAGGQVKDMRPAVGIAQRVDFGRAPAARAADGLYLLPPFPPLAERCALIDVESRDNVTASLPAFAKAVKIAPHRPRLAQRLKRL